MSCSGLSMQACRPMSRPCRGLYMSVHCRGRQPPAICHLSSYQLELTAAKTMDAIVNLGSEGRYALYDRSLHLADMTVNGGMLTYIVTPTIVLPVATPDTYFVGEGTVLTVAAPGVLDNDTGTGLTAYQTGHSTPGCVDLEHRWLLHIHTGRCGGHC